MDGSEHSPSEGILKTGDYVLNMNGVALTNKNDFVEEVKNSNGDEIVLSIRRDDKQFDIRILPQMNSYGEYKIGAWVRDSAQGIGTLTYVGQDQTFGALGHGINDSDTGTLMMLKTGQLYKTEIVDIKKGEDGNPGELTGVIRYTQSNIIGEIEYNTEIGIYGHIDTETANTLMMDPLPIATKAEIEIGPAQILCAVSGEPELYNIG